MKFEMEHWNNGRTRRRNLEEETGVVEIIVFNLSTGRLSIKGSLAVEGY